MHALKLGVDSICVTGAPSLSLADNIGLTKRIVKLVTDFVDSEYGETEDPTRSRFAAAAAAVGVDAVGVGVGGGDVDSNSSFQGRGNIFIRRVAVEGGLGLTAKEGILGK